jgi:hypothetical protein
MIDNRYDKIIEFASLGGVIQMGIVFLAKRNKF